MKKTVLLLIAFLLGAFPVSAEEERVVTMYSRYDGAPVSVYASEFEGLLDDYSLSFDIFKMYSREDGAEISVYANECAAMQEGYLTARQTAAMYSRYDLQKITVYGYEIAGLIQGYYTKGAQVAVYAKNGRTATISAGESEEYLKNGWSPQRIKPLSDIKREAFETYKNYLLSIMYYPDTALFQEYSEELVTAYEADNTYYVTLRYSALNGFSRRLYRTGAAKVEITAGGMVVTKSSNDI